MKPVRLLVAMGVAIPLCGCDPIHTMAYQVRNSTKSDFSIVVHDYADGPLSYGVDTVILLRPQEAVTVGWTQDICFSWERKRVLYKPHPSRWNFEVLKNMNYLRVLGKPILAGLSRKSTI